MNPLDVIIIVITVGFALAGLRQGFLVSVVSFIGFVVGGLLGLLLMPRLLTSQAPGRTRALVALVGVVLCATIVQALCAWLGGLLRNRITWRPARRVDAFAGALISAVAVLTVFWLLGRLCAGRPGRAVRERCPFVPSAFSRGPRDAGVAGPSHLDVLVAARHDRLPAGLQ